MAAPCWPTDFHTGPSIPIARMFSPGSALSGLSGHASLLLRHTLPLVQAHGPQSHPDFACSLLRSPLPILLPGPLQSSPPLCLTLPVLQISGQASLPQERFLDQRPQSNPCDAYLQRTTNLYPRALFEAVQVSYCLNLSQGCKTGLAFVCFPMPSH